MRRLWLILLAGGAFGACAPPAAFPSVSAIKTVEADRFAVIGDWGTGLESSEHIATRMCKWRKKHDFDLVVTTGDNIYPDGAASHFDDNFLEPFVLAGEGRAMA